MFMAYVKVVKASLRRARSKSIRYPLPSLPNTKLASRMSPWTYPQNAIYQACRQCCGGILVYDHQSYDRHDFFLSSVKSSSSTFTLAMRMISTLLNRASSRLSKNLTTFLLPSWRVLRYVRLRSFVFSGVTLSSLNGMGLGSILAQFPKTAILSIVLPTMTYRESTHLR